MPPLLLTWVVTMKTAAQTMFVGAPENRNSHSAVLNIHHPGGGRLHSYHRRGPFGNGVLYVHREQKPVPSPLIIHRISSPYNQHSKLSHQNPRAAEDMEMTANRSADASVPIALPGSGRAIPLSSILLAPTGYLNAEEINGISGKVPVETVVYPLAKTIQKHYIPRQPPFYVRLPPEHLLHHIPVAMVVTPPVIPQYFRSSNEDGIPLEERTPSLPTPRPSSLPPRPSSPPPAAPLPPLFFPHNNYYTFIPAENQTNEHQPPIPALHPPHHFPYNNCYAPAPESNERSSFSFQTSESMPPYYYISSKQEYYDPSELQMQQNSARSEENVDSSSRSFEQPPSYYFPKTGYQAYDPSKLQMHSARSEEKVDSSSRSFEQLPSYYFPKTGYQPYDSSKLQVLAKGEARTLPHHHASYHETVSHTPLLIHEGHGEGIHKHILIHHSEPAPYVHSELAPSLYDGLHLTHGGHSTYLHEEPGLHGHLSLNLARNAPSYDTPNMPHIYDDGFYQPMFSSVSDPWPVTSSVPYEYGNPSDTDYSSSPHIIKHNIPIYSRNIPNEEQQDKQQDLPYLLRRLRSFEGSEHKSTSNLDNHASSESDKSLTISLPVDMLNMADNETATKLQKKEAISEDNNPDFHPKTAKLLDLSQVLNPNEVKKRLILETILSTRVSNEEENSHKTVSPVNSGTRNFSDDFSESSALHQVEMGEEVRPKELHQEVPTESVTEIKDISLQSALHEPEKPIASLDTLWHKMRARRSKRETSQMQNNNTSFDSDSKITVNARSQEEERTVGYVIGFIDPEAYNHYYGSENTQNFASGQNYHINDYKQAVYDKSKHVLIPVYYRQSKTSSYTPVNLMSYKKTATSDPRSVREEVANPNITKNDGYWTYNKTARYNSYGTDSFPAYYHPYPIQHDSHNPELVPAPYQQFVEHLMPHRFLNTYPGKLLNPKAYPMYPYSTNKMPDSPMKYQQTSGYYSDISDYPGEPQMDTRSFSNMSPTNEHPIRHHHHPNRYNTHPNQYNKQGNVRPHDVNAHPIEHHPRPGRYYAYISQEPELHVRPYQSFNGANVHRPSRYYAHLSGYPREKPTEGRSFHTSDDAEGGPVRQHYTSRYYEHASGYPPRDSRYHDYINEGYYHPSRYFNPALAITPYSDTEFIGPYEERYDYPYQPNGDITSYQVDGIHQYPSRYHQHRRYHERIRGHSYQPTYHMKRFHPSRYHHSHRYEHVHSRDATPDSKIPEISEHPQMRSDEEETDEYPQTMQSGINLGRITKIPSGSNYPSKYYASGNPKSQIALVSFFTTDKQSPYPIRFHQLDPYGPAYHPLQYMNPSWEGGYNIADYFSKMEV